jgi:DNA-directed RNA polymerase specialized sigma24 family protein
MQTSVLVSEQIITEAVDQVLERVYQPAFLQVARYISKNGGSFDMARDIFHESLAIYYEQYKAGKAIESQINYITGIAKHLWLRHCKRNAQHVALDENLAPAVLPPEPTLNEVRLLWVLERTGKRCMDLLVSFYHEGLSLKKISQQFLFSSEHSASVQKYKCLEKVREVIKTKSIAYEDFFE